jgi:outer membrane receptor protein involved in Fe transport
VGGTRLISPTFNVAAAVGFQDFVQKGVKNRVGFTYNASLEKFGPYYRITARASQSTDETFGQLINIGFVRNQSYSVSADYFPTPAWLFRLQGTYTRADFKQSQNLSVINVASPSTVDKVYTVIASANYRLTRHLGVNLAYELVVRDSTQSLSDTSNNRVTFSIFADIWR